MYYYHLINDNNETGEHYHMKSVTLDLIPIYSKENNITVIQVFDKIDECESVTFDLLK